MKNKLGILFLIVISCTGILYGVIHKETETNLQKGIASEVIRFHVIANSDAEIDQSVKLKVKDQVVRYLQKRLKGVSNRQDAKNIMKEELKNVERVAARTVRKEGYHYSCKAVYHNRNFPVKVYGDLTFPAGKYEALDVTLGKAKGKNWWCVMFPTLCFVDGTYSIVPDQSKKLLKGVLTEEEYDAILEGDGTVEYKFKCVQWLKDLF